MFLTPLTTWAKTLLMESQNLGYRQTMTKSLEEKHHFEILQIDRKHRSKKNGGVTLFIPKYLKPVERPDLKNLKKTCPKVYGLNVNYLTQNETKKQLTNMSYNPHITNSFENNYTRT